MVGKLCVGVGVLLQSFEVALVLGAGDVRLLQYNCPFNFSKDCSGASRIRFSTGTLVSAVRRAAVCRPRTPAGGGLVPAVDELAALDKGLLSDDPRICSAVALGSGTASAAAATPPALSVAMLTSSPAIPARVAGEVCARQLAKSGQSRDYVSKIGQSYKLTKFTSSPVVNREQ
eukprot:6185771-Pleurochrysis_carterae.AAC.2